MEKVLIYKLNHQINQLNTFLTMDLQEFELNLIRLYTFSYNGLARADLGMENLYPQYYYVYRKFASKRQDRKRTNLKGFIFEIMNFPVYSELSLESLLI